VRLVRHHLDRGTLNQGATASFEAARNLVHPRFAAGIRSRPGDAAAYIATGHPRQAAALASEQLALARKTGTAVTLGSALQEYAAAVPAEDPGRALSEAVRLPGSRSARVPQTYRPRQAPGGTSRLRGPHQADLT